MAISCIFGSKVSDEVIRKLLDSQNSEHRKTYFANGGSLDVVTQCYQARVDQGVGSGKGNTRFDECIKLKLEFYQQGTLCSILARFFSFFSNPIARANYALIQGMTAKFKEFQPINL
jgi:hypothetical protein